MGQTAGCPEDCDWDEGAGAGTRLGGQESRTRRPPTPRRSRVGKSGEATRAPGRRSARAWGSGRRQGRGPTHWPGMPGESAGDWAVMGGGARSAPRARDLDHTPCHAAGSAIERVSAQDSHRSPICSRQLDRTQPVRAGGKVPGSGLRVGAQSPEGSTHPPQVGVRPGPRCQRAAYGTLADEISPSTYIIRTPIETDLTY